MRWASHDTGDLLAFQADAVDATIADRRASAMEAWATVEHEVLPRHALGDWDVLRLEIWADSGRTIIFPAREPFVERTDKALVDIHWPHLQASWDSGERDADLSDQEFEARIANVRGSIIDALRGAFEESPLRHQVRVHCYSYGEELLCTFGDGRTRELTE